MEVLLITIFKNGTIAFLGSKITRALQQKEISEIIEASGWCIIGIDVIKLVIPIIKGIEKFFDRMDKSVENFDKVIESIKTIMPK